ncbi:MAG TPA: hypothetical protein DHV14_10375 [Micrococcales bacterium]|nr:hypothetical protein [Micrococcales bacterium]
MSETRRPTRSRAALVGAAGLGLLGLLGSLTFSSAAALGGLATEDLGAADGDPHLLDDVTLAWTPEWTDGAWRLADLTVTADADRGFHTGDIVEVTLAGDADCELATQVTGAEADVRFDRATLADACGALPALAVTTAVAVAVTGTDDVTEVTDLGPLRGSVAGFTGDGVLTTDATVTSADDGISAVVAVLPADAGLSAADLDGATVTAVLTDEDGADPTTYATTASVTSDGELTSVSADLSGAGWVVDEPSLVHLAVSVPQVLAPTGAAGVVLAEATASPEGTDPVDPTEPTSPTDPVDQTDPTDPVDPTVPTDPKGPTVPTGTTDGLDAVAVSAGIAYSRPMPWTGEQTNNLTFCHSFTVTNTTGAALEDWTVTFDTDLAPMWGLNPTAGTVSLSNIATRSFDASTGLWVVGGSNEWAKRIEAGGSRTVQFCATSVPTPAANPDLFDVAVRVVAHNDWYVTFEVTVTSESQYYVPWKEEVDLAQLVCGTSLTNHPLSFQQVTATPVAGSGTSYVIEGTRGNTQLVSVNHPRTFTFASYSPGAGWQLPCGG